MNYETPEWQRSLQVFLKSRMLANAIEEPVYALKPSQRFLVGEYIVLSIEEFAKPKYKGMVATYLTAPNGDVWSEAFHQPLKHADGTYQVCERTRRLIDMWPDAFHPYK